jgi:acetyl-CoA C-acetyltransferase
MHRVAVIGVGHTRFGRRDDASVLELAAEAFRLAIADAGIEPTAIEATAIGSVPEYHTQRSLGGAVQTYLNLAPAPVWLSEAACASGSAALRTGWLMIRSAAHRVVAVLGCQKLTELPTGEVSALMGRVGDAAYESVFGTTFPGYYALFARRHMHEYGTTREQLAAVAVKNHRYGALNPLAMFRKPVTLQQVMSSPEVATPLRLLDCCANADGAACVILADQRFASKLQSSHPRVFLDGSGAASASMSVLQATDLTGVPSAREAARQAYEQASVTPRDIKVAQVHDGFTITEIMAYEDLGFCDRGQGGPFVESGETLLSGSVPVNVDGGIKAKGHPVGATGVSMAVEIVRQLRAECGELQVKNADVGLTHNVGGVGQYVFVNVFRREA